MSSPKIPECFRKLTVEPEFAVTLRDGQWEILAKETGGLRKCPSCGGTVKRHGWKKSAFIDAPLRGCPSRVLLARPRFKCRDCGKTTLLVDPSLDDVQRCTVRLRDFVRQRLASDLPPTSVREVAQEIGASTTFVSSLLRQIAQEAARTVSTHIDLGIYEVNTRSSHRWVLIDLDSATPLEIVPAGRDHMSELRDALRRLTKIYRLQTVSIPLNSAVAGCVIATCDAVPVRVSLASIHDAIAKVICRIGGLDLRKGRQDAQYRARLREVAAHRFRRLVNSRGIRPNRPPQTYATFWQAYEAKESLFRSLRCTATGGEFAILRSWLATLPDVWIAEFRTIVRDLAQVQSVGVEISRLNDMTSFDEISFVVERLCAAHCESLHRDLALASIWLSGKCIDCARSDSSLEGNSDAEVDTSCIADDADPPTLADMLEFLSKLACFTLEYATPADAGEGKRSARQLGKRRHGPYGNSRSTSRRRSHPDNPR